MADKRICAVSLSRGEPVIVLAGYKDGQLHIIKSEPLISNLGELKKTLPDRLSKYRKAGFVVLVDEVLHVFSRHGRRVRLDQNGQDGRPVLVSALEIYRNMDSLRALTYPQSDSGSFDIPNSVVDERRDASGRVVYHIDWESLTSKQVALLLCINAATSDNIFDKSSTQSLFALLGGKARARRENSMLGRFKKLTSKIDAELVPKEPEPVELNRLGIKVYKGGCNE